MLRCVLVLVSVCVGQAALASPSVVEIFCDDRKTLIEKLERNFGAERQGRGMRGPGTIIELWTIPSTGEWTLVQSYTDGRSCVVAMGEEWEPFLPDPDPA